MEEARVGLLQPNENTSVTARQRTGGSCTSVDSPGNTRRASESYPPQHSKDREEACSASRAEFGRLRARQTFSDPTRIPEANIKIWSLWRRTGARGGNGSGRAGSAGRICARRILRGSVGCGVGVGAIGGCTARGIRAAVHIFSSGSIRCGGTHARRARTVRVGSGCLRIGSGSIGIGGSRIGWRG